MLYFAARNAAARLSPNLAVSLPPVSQATLLRRSAEKATHPDYKVDAATVELAQRAALWEPLAFAPFFIAARAAEQNGDTARAIALLEEARRRRPTWLATRLLLVSSYFKTGRLREMTQEVDFVLRTNERARIVLLPELVKLLNSADGRRFVAEVLANDPSWKQDFFRVARDSRVPSENAADLLRIARARGGNVAEEQRLYFTSLITSGRPDLARAQWLETLSAEDRAQSRFLSNGNFRSGIAASEFGWNLASLDVGRADIVTEGEQGRLRVQYFGGSAAALAQQQIALAPGRYRLQISGRTGSGPAGEQLSWIIACQAEGRNLVRIPVSRFPQSDGVIATEFTVPSGACPAQLLRLNAEPGDMSAPADADFSRVEIANVR